MEGPLDNVPTAQWPSLCLTRLKSRSHERSTVKCPTAEGVMSRSYLFQGLVTWKGHHKKPHSSVALVNILPEGRAGHMDTWSSSSSLDIALLSRVGLAPPGISSVAFFVSFGRGDASTLLCQ